MYIVVPNEFLKTTTESSSLVIQLPSAPEEGVMAHCCGIPECWLNWQRLVQWQRQYNLWKREEYGYTISQFHNHAQWLKVRNSGGPLDNQTWHTNGWLLQNSSKVWFLYSHNCTLANGAVFHFFPAKFDYPVACQKFSLLATA